METLDIAWVASAAFHFGAAVFVVAGHNGEPQPLLMPLPYNPVAECEKCGISAHHYNADPDEADLLSITLRLRAGVQRSGLARG